MSDTIEIKAQPGPQEMFQGTEADIAFYGGAAGGGKTYAMLMEPLRHMDNGDFSGVIFRRQMPMITNPGALWDESMKLYSLLNAEPNIQQRRWTFPSGMSMKFSHLFNEDDKYAWQGSQVPFLGFEEVTHFTKTQFFYMLSRVRSVSGVPGYIRGTCNPDPDSWVADFISWWIDQDEKSPTYGLAIPERAGVLRWFIKIEDDIIWADSQEEFIDVYGEEFMADHPPMSMTFIPAKLSDNKKLMDSDPGYRAKLMALDRVERERLLGGNWKIRAKAGEMFKKEWFKTIDVAPINLVQRIRYWDRAATPVSATSPNPDWTVGTLWGITARGEFIVLDVVRLREGPGKVEEAILNTAKQDGKGVSIGIEKDPGQAGVVEANHYVRKLAGYDVKIYAASQSKIVRAKPVSAQAENGNITLVKGIWNKAWLDEHEAFPSSTAKDDQVDTSSGALNHLAGNTSGEFTKSMSQSDGNTEQRWS